MEKFIELTGRSFLSSTVSFQNIQSQYKHELCSYEISELQYLLKKIWRKVKRTSKNMFTKHWMDTSEQILKGPTFG